MDSCSRSRRRTPVVASTPRLATPILLVAALLASARAGAQSRGLEQAAEQAFADAMQAMKEGDYERACPLIEESLRYDPGMAAKFRLAECYEQQGRLATAWETYLEVSEDAHAAGMDERAQFARQRAEAIAPRLSSLIIEVPPELALDRDLEVRCDGALVSRPFWGAPMPMDPGRYRIVVSSPGRGRWVRFAHVEADGATQTVTIRRHGRPDETPEEETGAPTASSGSVTPWTVAGLTAAVAGAGLLGSGLGVGLVAGNRYDDAAAHCVDNQCDPVGTEIRQGALEQATTATVLVVVGSGVLVGGTLLWLLAPSDEDQASDDAAHGHRRDASLALHLAPSGLLLRGAW